MNDLDTMCMVIIAKIVPTSNHHDQIEIIVNTSSVAAEGS